MKNKISLLMISASIFLAFGMLISCTGTPVSTSSVTQIHVLAVESFLADITKQVSGNRVIVDSLIPVGVDPHSFEPAPRDAQTIAQSKMIIINGGGMESWLPALLTNAGTNIPIITASDGLTPRKLQPGENPALFQGEPTDPHFWMNPLNAVQYVKNIRDGLTQIDPAGKDSYASNADAYISQLTSLDQWITQQVDQITVSKRLLVTNHETFGYFADHYGFKIIGTIIPSFSTDASPSAQELAALETAIKATGVKTIFVEVGANPQLALQIAQDTGTNVNTTLYTHSLSTPNGPAPTYIDMLKYDVTTIVDSLK